MPISPDLLAVKRYSKSASVNLVCETSALTEISSSSSISSGGGDEAAVLPAAVVHGGEDGTREIGDDGGGDDAKDSGGGGDDDLEANIARNVCCLIVVEVE